MVQGNHQIKGVDYNEVYANTAKSGSIRMLLAIAAAEGLQTAQLDALNAFFNGNLAETTQNPIRALPIFTRMVEDDRESTETYRL